MLMKQRLWMGMSFSLVELAVDERLNNLQFRCSGRSNFEGYANGIQQDFGSKQQYQVVQICNQGKDQTWTEQNFVADLNHLQQLGLTTHYLFVPKDISSYIIDLAAITTCFPVRQCRLNPDHV